MRYLRESNFSTYCPAKGRAVYWDVVVGGSVKRIAAFSYPECKIWQLEGKVAFWADGTTLTVT